MQIGSLRLNPCDYVNPMPAFARRVAIRNHEVFFFTQLEKPIHKPFGAIERCLASREQGEGLELRSEAL